MGILKEFPLYLPNRRRGILLIPSPMTPDEFRLLEMQIDGAIDIARQLWIVEEQLLPRTDEQPAAVTTLRDGTQIEHIGDKGHVRVRPATEQPAENVDYE